MILAAAACAAAGISYIFNDDEQSIKHETVTVSSTIVDKQGIVKYIIQRPRFINHEQKGNELFIKKYKSNQIKIPIENENLSINKQLSFVFFWSIPLKAKLIQTATKSCLIIENCNPFQRHSMKISIGIQNIPSEIALSYSDENSLSYNNDIIPIGILKKKTFEINENENDKKRFCLDRNEKNRMRNMIFKNVNLCVENLSKILTESCSNSTLQSKEYSDGIILHRGKQFGMELGEPMRRKHSINELNRLLSKRNCLLMREYNIESIEDLIRLFLEEGEINFTNIMINLFKVNPNIVEQLNSLLLNWSKHLT